MREQRPKPARIQPFGDNRWRLYDRHNNFIILTSAELRQLGHRLIQDANRVDGNHINRIKNASNT